MKGVKMAYTLDSTIGTILDDLNAVKILDKYIPGISTNPLIGMARGMTIGAVLNMPQAKQAGITKEAVEKVLAEINTIKK